MGKSFFYHGVHGGHGEGRFEEELFSTEFTEHGEERFGEEPRARGVTEKGFFCWVLGGLFLEKGCRINMCLIKM